MPLDYKEFDSDSKINASSLLFPLDEKCLSVSSERFADYKLEVSDDAPLGEIFRNPCFSDGMFFYPDELQGGVLLFRQKEGSRVMSFVSNLRPNADEKDCFVDVDTATYKRLSAANNLYYIVCNAAFLDNGHIGLSYSLPRVFFEKKGEMAYYNEACILSRKLPGLEADSMTDFKLNLYDGYFYKHFQFSSTGGSVIIGCERLVEDSRNKMPCGKEEKEADQFLPEFYKNGTPFLAQFDRTTGRMIRRFGSLDGIAEKTLTGYFYSDPVSVVNGSELAYTDGYSGNVYVADTSDVSKEKSCYRVFCLDDRLLPSMDSTKFYTEGYERMYRGFFCRQIQDIRITPDMLYCVVCYGDSKSFMGRYCRYTFVTIDRRTGERREYLYPEEDGYTVFTRGLREKDGRVYPFSVLKRDGEALLRVYGEGGAEL